MTKTAKYDVIIVGAGPAGSTAGFILSRRGLNVLILDKNTFPRKKLCAGLITLKTVTLLQRVFGETVDSLQKKDIINFESDRYEVFCKDRLITRRENIIPFRFIDREVYDNYILHKAREAGAEIIEGDGVAIRSLDVLKNTVTTLSGRRFSADFIIGADGVNSRIRRSFPVDLFGRDNWSGNLAVGHEILLNRRSVNRDVSSPSLFFDFIDRGYAWIIPNRETVKIGMCALNRTHRKDILAAFKEFLSSTGLKGATDEKIFSYVLPYGSYLPSPVFRNVMLIGDAAGFADPLLGEGIFFAQRSAELAAQAILEITKSEGPIEKSYKLLENRYTTLLQEHIYTEFVYAEKIRNFIFTYLNKFRYLPLKIAMSILGSRPIEAVHGLRSYQWLRRL